MSMAMAFHAGVTETILFAQWTTTDAGTMVASAIGIFFMAFLYEGLKVAREHLAQQAARSSNSVTMNKDEHTYNEFLITRKRTPFTLPHVVQTLLHMIQMFVSYLLMLIFMTYNCWLCLAVIIGGGAGFFAFAWLIRSKIDINEHCH